MAGSAFAECVATGRGTSRDPVHLVLDIKVDQRYNSRKEHRGNNGPALRYLEQIAAFEKDKTHLPQYSS